MPNPKFEQICFAFTLLLVLFPVFLIEYWVTGDAPCHLYNSKIISDILFEDKREFYDWYLTFNEHAEPNWISNLLQIPLISILPSSWVDRIFFSAYLLTFCLGFRRLILSINSHAAFLSSLGCLFAINHLLMKGFTNNAWSIAIWFWILAYWIRNIEKESKKIYLILSIGLYLLIFSHPMGYAFGLASLACVSLVYGLVRLPEYGLGNTLLLLKNQFMKGLLCALPSLLVFIQFYLRRGGQTLSMQQVWEEISSRKSLVALSSSEEILAFGVSVLIGILFIVFLFLRLKRETFSPFDGLGILLIVAVYLMLNIPSNLAGGLDMGMRLSLFTSLLLLVFMATADFPVVLSKIYGVCAVIFASAFLYIRLPILINASQLAKEVMSVAPYIKDESTLLTLNYDWSGKTPKGAEIADRAWLFNHVDCYLGAEKPLIISDNYELHMWYFPLVERRHLDMYWHTDVEGFNFDHRPPRADFVHYRERTGAPKDIEYVLMLSYRDEFYEHAFTQDIFKQLEDEYHWVFTSEHKRSILFERSVKKK